MNKLQSENHWKQIVSDLQHIAAVNNISQGEIARRTGMSQQAVQRFFKQLFCPTARVLQQIADAVGYDIRPVNRFINQKLPDNQISPQFLFSVDPINNELYILHRHWPACLIWVKQETPMRFIILDLYDDVEHSEEIHRMPFVQQAKDFFNRYARSLFIKN